MTLVDTSVWIDFFAARDTPPVALLESLIEQGEDLCLCGVILTEVLQGIRDDTQYDKTSAIFSNLIFLPMNRDTFFIAASIYRTLRSKGITIRNSIDCMIAAVCIEQKVRLLHNDRDFGHIGRAVDLDIVTAVSSGHDEF